MAEHSSAEWIERLAAALDMDVRGAADWTAAEKEHRRDCCYVMLGGMSAEAPETIGTARQMARVRMITVLALTSHRDAAGAAAMRELDDARRLVRSALLGWQPRGADGPVGFASGALLGYVGRTLFWADEWEAAWLISES